MLLLGGCATYSLPETEILSDAPRLTASEAEAIEAMRPPLPENPLSPVDLPEVPSDFKWMEAGEELTGGIRVTEDLVEFQRLKQSVETDRALAALARYEAQLTPQESAAALFVSERRTTLLVVSARPFEAERELLLMERREIAVYGSNMGSISLRGHLSFWRKDPDTALTYYARVLGALGDWRVPSVFLAYPLNLERMLYVGITQIRSMLGLSLAYLIKGDYERALAWGAEYHARMREIISIYESPLYGAFVKPPAEIYYGYGWALTTLASARTAYTRNLAANEALYDAALTYFEAAGAADGPLVVDCLRELAAFQSGVAPLPTHRIGPLPEPKPLSGPDKAAGLSRPPEKKRQLRSWFGLARSDGTTLPVSDEALDKVALRFAGVTAGQDRALPVPKGGSVKLPAVGERTVYGFTVTPELSRAQAAYLEGDGDAALAALDQAETKEPRGLYAFELAFLRAQVLIMIGRAADAEEVIERADALEAAAFGSNLNSRALRGEARLWLGDLGGAILDLEQVAEALGDWKLPTYTVCPPAEIPQAVNLVRAQNRTYVAIAQAHFMARNYEAAEAWAERGEEVMQDTFFMVFHPLYGEYAAIHSDMYYGRGLVLGVLGAAQIVTRRDAAAGNDAFDRARAYFDALGFATGSVTIEGFRVRALLEIGRADIAEPLARSVAELAVEKGLADLVWQMEALRGEILLALDRPIEAEKAFRRALAAIEAVSGSLASDRSKRRFGVGKGDVARRLISLDIGRGDLAQLFEDLETSRARAFVDMLGQNPVAVDRQPTLVAEIRDIDNSIRRQRLLNAAPHGATSDGTARERALLSERRRALARLATRDPELADAFSIRATSLRAVQRRIRPGTILAYALPFDDAAPIRFLIVDRERARLLTSDLTGDEVFQLLSVFDPTRVDIAAATERAAAQRLKEGLNFDAWGARDLAYVVPSGDLYFMPWGALPIELPVVVLPTGSWLGRMPTATVAGHAAIVVGDPQLGRGWTPLPGARAEARSIGRIYGSRAILGPEATEENMRAAIGDGTRVLHIASHGEFVSSDPMQSAIILSDQGDAYRLTAARLFERPLLVKFVVLSACETGLGRSTADDDFLGLTRSFYLGGALSVMNSLWPVRDEPTRRFMEVFHRRATGGRLDQAWLAARDSLRRAGHPPSVYGAFVLGGSPSL